MRLQQNINMTTNIKCRGLLDMVSSILYLNGSYCCRCNKSLSKTEVKQCNGCHRMAYCSKACQKEDWFNGGHMLACCKSYTDETAEQFQGRILPTKTPENERAAMKLKDLEINMNMIQLKLFLDNSETILDQARILGIPLCDCVVAFDLRACPHTIEVQGHNENYMTPEAASGFDETHSKENITCVYVSPIFIGAVVESPGESGSTPHLKIQRLFPHEWLVNRNDPSPSRGNKLEA